METRLQNPARRVLALLTIPRCAPDLCKALGVSRQRVHQLLQQLLRRNVIIKLQVKGERGRNVYVVRENLTGSLTPRLAAVLSGLRQSEFSTVGSVGGLSAYRTMVELQSLRLVTLVRLGNTSAATLTIEGLQHPQYCPDAPKFDAADLVHLLGGLRTSFIRVLFVLGQARAADLSLAMPKSFRRSGSTSSHLITSMRKVGLITRGKSQGCYELTSLGACLAAALNFSEGPLDAAVVREGMERRRREIRNRRREIVRTRLHAGEAHSPTARTVLDTLANHGALTAQEIYEKGALGLENRRSIRLLLQSLENRGVVERERVPTGGLLRRGRYGAHVWILKPAGLRFGT